MQSRTLSAITTTSPGDVDRSEGQATGHRGAHHLHGSALSQMQAHRSPSSNDMTHHIPTLQSAKVFSFQDAQRASAAGAGHPNTDQQRSQDVYVEGSAHATAISPTSVAVTQPAAYSRPLPAIPTKVKPESAQHHANAHGKHRDGAQTGAATADAHAVKDHRVAHATSQAHAATTSHHSSSSSYAQRHALSKSQPRDSSMQSPAQHHSGTGYGHSADQDATGRRQDHTASTARGLAQHQTTAHVLATRHPHEHGIQTSTSTGNVSRSESSSSSRPLSRYTRSQAAGTASASVTSTHARLSNPDSRSGNVHSSRGAGANVGHSSKGSSAVATAAARLHKLDGGASSEREAYVVGPRLSVMQSAPYVSF